MNTEKINIEYEIIMSKEIASDNLYNKAMLDKLMEYTKKYFYLLYDKIYKSKRIVCTNANRLFIYKIINSRILLASIDLFDKHIFERKFHECVYLEIIEKLTKIYENAFIIWNPDCDKLIKKVDDELHKILNDFIDSYVFEANKKTEILSVLKSNISDILTIKFGNDIAKYDTEYVNKKFLSNIRNLRHEFVEKLGYYFHSIHLLNDPNFKNAEYQIFVRNKLVSKGTFQHDKLDTLIDIIDKLKPILIKYVHVIFSVQDTYLYLEHVKKEHSSKIVENLLKELDINDIKTIFCNLIQREISIRDLPYVVENLANFARFDKDTDILTEKMAQVLK